MQWYVVIIRDYDVDDVIISFEVCDRHLGQFYMFTSCNESILPSVLVECGTVLVSWLKEKISCKNIFR
jgi:hypothetical protein